MVQTIIATFENQSVMSLDFQLSQGLVPGKGTAAFATGVIIPITGYITISDGFYSLILGPLYATNPRTVYDANTGNYISVDLTDRRYGWTNGYINGLYNQSTYDGYPIEDTNLEDLIKLCFVALDESKYKLVNIPVAYPPVLWEYENPAIALSDLCEKYKLSIGYDIDNYIVITPVELNRVIPVGYISNYEISIENDIFPKYVRIVGGRCVIQRTFSLVPVGEETDGSIKKIDDLSYKTSQTWANEMMDIFSNIPNRRNRELAEKSIGKWFAIDWTVYDKDKILPLLNIITDTVVNEGIMEHDKPYAKSSKTIFDGTQYTTIANARLTEGYSIDKKLGIVKFNKPLFLSGSDGPEAGSYTIPSVSLVAAYESKEGNDEDFIYWNSSLIPGGTELPIIIKEKSLVPYFIYGITNPANLVELTAYANILLDRECSRLCATYPEEATYAGIMPVGCYGSFVNVSFKFDATTGASTVIQKHFEIPDLNLPPYKEILRKKKVDKELVNPVQKEEDRKADYERGSGSFGKRDEIELDIQKQLGIVDSFQAARATNKYAGIIPGKSFVEITGYDRTNDLWEIDRPSGDSIVSVGIVPEDIAESTNGVVLFGGIKVVEKDVGYDSPAVGDIVGTKEDDFQAQELPNGTHVVVEINGNDLYLLPLNGSVSNIRRAITQEGATVDGLISVNLLNSSGEETGEAFDVYVFLDGAETDFTSGYILAHTGLVMAEVDYIVIFKDVDGKWYMSSVLIKVTTVTVVGNFSSGGALEMVGDPDTNELHVYEADIYVLGINTETDGLVDQDVTTVCGAE